MTDPYSVLGVGRNATPDDIKKAYRKLAHQHHPDKKGGDGVKFKEINEAYQILSDPDKRRQYDSFGSVNDGQGYGGFYGGGQPYGWDFGSAGGGFEDIFDLFSRGFSTGGQREAAKGEDIYVQIPVNRKDLGTTKIFEFNVFKTCEECGASGIAKGAKLKTCDTCKGAGQIKQETRTMFGNISFATVCPTCKGKRKIPEKVCAKCKGTGRYDGTSKIEIRIPSEMKDNYHIAIPHGGNAGVQNKPAGDLIITLKIK